MLSTMFAMKPSQKSENCFQELLDKVKSLSNDDIVLINKLKNCYENTNNYFLWSNEFIKIVEKYSSRILNKKSSIKNCVEGFCKHLEEYKSIFPLKHLINEETKCSTNNIRSDNDIIQDDDIDNSVNLMNCKEGTNHEIKKSLEKFPSENELNKEVRILSTLNINISKDLPSENCRLNNLPSAEILQSSFNPCEVNCTNLYKSSSSKYKRAVSEIINNDMNNMEVKSPIKYPGYLSQKEPSTAKSFYSISREISDAYSFRKRKAITILDQTEDTTEKKICVNTISKSVPLTVIGSPEKIQLNKLNVHKFTRSISEGSLKLSNLNDVICLDDNEDDDDILFVSETRKEDIIISADLSLNSDIRTNLLNNDNNNLSTSKNKISFNPTPDVVVICNDDEKNPCLQIKENILKNIRDTLLEQNSPALDKLN